MSLATDLTAREAEVIRTIKLLSARKDKFVVIGGYAVNAVTSHRFSIDCDLVVARSNVGMIGGILAVDGYRRQTKHAEHAVRMEKFTKLVGGRRVSVDMFVDRVVSRETAAEWTYDFIKRNSLESDVVGLTASARAFVPESELLIAMKLHAGRGADLRDIAMMSEHADWKLVSKFAETGVKRKMIRQVDNAIMRMSTNQFSSALKAEFGLSVDVTPLIMKSVRGLNAVKSLLS